MKTTTLRPGLLVSLKTSITGNVTYKKRTTEEAHFDSTGAQIEAWETERTVIDPAEMETAKKARNKASSIIRGVCAQSAFGLLCPASCEDNLERAIADARAVADAFNRTAGISRISVYVITGRVADNDVEAQKAINSEIRDLLDTMRNGVKELDPDAIREAANKARSVAQMLSPSAQDFVQEAIDTARKVAREIVKAGESAAIEVDSLALAKITDARTAFLDMDDQPREVAAPGPAAAPAVDFESEATTEEQAQEETTDQPPAQEPPREPARSWDGMSNEAMEDEVRRIREQRNASPFSPQFALEL